MLDRVAFGRWGEDFAVAHLVAQGVQVLDRNWRCSHGELDVVALDRDGTFVFVEVKARRTAAFGQPSEAVDARKTRRIRRLAVLWLADHGRHGEMRFDVVSVVRQPGCVPVLEHLRAAF